MFPLAMVVALSLTAGVHAALYGACLLYRGAQGAVLKEAIVILSLKSGPEIGRAHV